MNADGYRGIFEAAGNMLNDNGGVMLWKLNAAFPSVVWQVYDWYLQPNAGYYFMQRACEPVHIQLNLDDSMVAIINRSYISQTDLTVEAEVFDITGKSLFKQSQKSSLKGSDVKETISLSGILASQEGVTFSVLHLKDKKGNVISSTTFCLQAKHYYTCMT